MPCMTFDHYSTYLIILLPLNFQRELTSASAIVGTARSNSAIKHSDQIKRQTNIIHIGLRSLPCRYAIE